MDFVDALAQLRVIVQDVEVCEWMVVLCVFLWLSYSSHVPFLIAESLPGGKTQTRPMDIFDDSSDDEKVTGSSKGLFGGTVIRNIICIESLFVSLIHVCFHVFLVGCHYMVLDNVLIHGSFTSHACCS